MRIAHDGLVVVADGNKMMLFKNKGSPTDLNLELVQLREQDNPPNREQKSDAPGRAFSSMGNGRSAYEEADFHAIEEARFAVETAELLRKGALDNEFDSLWVVAPPATLGALRKHYHKEVESRLKGEIAKNLTGHPVPQIEKILIEA
ncbi:host attachment family protein [Sphingomonas sp. LaA6.9]|uniref:host attachment family protein n=1 Tax=Sphingomonas sp. LaA6.9 TaxID=2919914 RepID=UPI001F503BCE|nr:host attachment family protein [Sphingomonas sp. LaA6.9]MCJ8157802.1 host attachment family protein [Sphingomonas sp. LaA6.9]